MDGQRQWVVNATAARIRQLRRQRDMSQEDLALRAGINPVYYGQLERGQKCPTIDTLYKISTGLGVPLQDLFRLEPAPDEAENVPARLEKLLDGIPREKLPQFLKVMEDVAGLL